MNAVLQNALDGGESIFVVFAHGGESSRETIQNEHVGLKTWYYTPPGQCTYAGELKPIISALKNAIVPPGRGHMDLKCDTRIIANTHFQFHDAKGAVEKIVDCQFGLWRLNKKDGLTKERVNLTSMSTLSAVLLKARQSQIKHVLQLSCKAESKLAEITGACRGCGVGRVVLNPQKAPVNILLDTQCVDCLQSVRPAHLRVAGFSWGMELSVLIADSGTVETRIWPMHKTSGTVAHPQVINFAKDFGVSPADEIRELIVTLQ